MDEQTVNLIKWLLYGAVAGYVPLGLFIAFLVKELLKAKEQGINIMQAATVHNKTTIDTMDKTNCMIEKVVALLK